VAGGRGLPGSLRVVLGHAVRHQARDVESPASLAAVSDSSQIGAATPFSSRLPRYSWAAAALAAVLIVAAIVLVVRGGDSHARAGASAKGTSATTGGARRVASGSNAPPAKSPASAQSRASAAAGAGAAKRVNVAETADPEEASSFPAPASAHHKAAASPASASEQIVAAGAPSDAEVKQELKQMQAAEQSAKQEQTRRLKPVPGGESVGGNGTIPIPANMPEAVQRVIAGANAIADFPYVFGGGHASFVDNAYDCSGSVSYALAAGGLISAPETSGELEHWGAPGPGRYISVFANAGHTYMYVDGVLFDTAGRSGVYASRWQVAPTDNAGYVERHPPGL
jgi:cell wall-associated NlpC family hydrolase